MGYVSRKLLPACVCCPSLNPSSRRPVKRYKKLLAEIFPKNMDSPPNERKIMKLCEYAAKNPLRIPKIVKFLEQRNYKELRSNHVSFVKIIMEAYSKLLYICKEQMAYFAISLLNIIVELLDSKQHDNVRVLGCETLTRFIYSQADNTYARNIESLVQKVCMLADGKENKSLVQAASLQCLSAMIWYMTEYSYIFADFDEIIHVILENYCADKQLGDENDDRFQTHHNWVDEVVRSETRGCLNVNNDASPGNKFNRPRLEAKDSALLTQEERESPEVWSRICIQKLAELVDERTTMRRLLEPMFFYFDTGLHWAPRNVLALSILSDIAYSGKKPGNDQLILTSIIRHLDHKNVVHDPQLKSDIIQTATTFTRQLRSRTVIVDVGSVTDLCRHLRKSLQATVESAGLQEANLNDSLQNSIEDCLLEIIKGIADGGPIYDMMAITLEKLSETPAVARATIGSLLIIAHIISLTSFNSLPQMLPETLFVQLLKAMMHPDVETRIGVHQIFCVIIGRSCNPMHSRCESEYLFETKKWQIRTTSVFESATALLEKLRREKECLKVDKLGIGAASEVKTKSMGDEELKGPCVRKTVPYFNRLTSSIIERLATSTSPACKDLTFISLTEDQTAQLLYAFWIQSNRSDNTPMDFEAIAHSFNLALISSSLKTNCTNTLQLFQMLLSLRSVSLNQDGLMPPSCRRSLFVMATALLAFTTRIYNITGLNDLLKVYCSSEIDPYLRIGEYFQIYVCSQMDVNCYGSESDQQAAIRILSDMNKTMGDCNHHLLVTLVCELSSLTGLDKDIVARQLAENFTPEAMPLYDLHPAHDFSSIENVTLSDESVSLDEECSRCSSVDGDLLSHSPTTDVTRFMPRMPTSPAVSNVISVSQLLESALHVAGQVAGTSVSTSPLPFGTMTSQCEALGMGTRKKLSSWLVGGHDSVPDVSSPTFRVNHQSSVQKVNGFGSEEHSFPAESWVALQLPPASPFDNFWKAAGC